MVHERAASWAHSEIRRPRQESWGHAGVRHAKGGGAEGIDTPRNLATRVGPPADPIPPFPSPKAPKRGSPC